MAESGVCWECNNLKVKGLEKEAYIKSKLIKLFGSEKKMLELSFENFDQVPGTVQAFVSCETFNPDKNNLYLWGKTGRGKTHLAYATLQKWAKLGKSFDLMTIRDFVTRFRLLKPNEEKSLTEELVSIDVLVIDDLGRVQSSDFSLDILENIIDKRSIRSKNGLILTSNLFLDDLALKNQEDRLTSRLSGLCKVIEINSDHDYRLEKRKLLEN